MAREITRRQALALAAGAAGTLATGGVLGELVLPLLAREDLIPGPAPDVTLVPRQWPTGVDQVDFVAIGDNGTGGRQAMAVAERMALTYQQAPFGLVVLLGDISYYGSLEDRFEHVFQRPMQPLLDAGVRFELAIGNHDEGLHHPEESLAEIEAELRLLGTPGRYYGSSHGPVDLFYLDSSVPGVFGPDASEQWDWLDAALGESQNRWKVVALHHPPYSSGRHGSTPGARRRLGPIARRHAVDLVLSGHDHHYERTEPIYGTTYVVSGGGSKTTAVGRSWFTAYAESTLHFLHVQVAGDRLVARAVRADGSVADRFSLRAREGR